MDEASITRYITETFDGVHPVEAWGDTFFFYNPDRKLPDKIYFATLKHQDDDYDSASDLNRPSVFRLNIGVGKATYRSLFGSEPPRPGASGAADTGHDVTSLDQLLPHPVYARAHWICVLNPSAARFEAVRPLLAEAYDLAVGKYAKQASSRETLMRRASG
ncbi:MAG TPA: DUF6194 family protein [Actinomycetota bacterium]|jgi:hypothetical protein